ncbi:MAG: type II toxin-antitoxin system RelE/ParE family toxin [Kiritimatiellae bacterium]|nr:type II toxin-antitoxin system RelE/ParE family toxin [Kiritimatiellia bacterium]
MSYNITFKKTVEKDLKRISKQNAKRILGKIDTELSKHPDRYHALTCPFSGLRKFRIGDYRVIFAIMDSDVLILRVQNRKDVYKKK